MCACACTMPCAMCMYHAMRVHMTSWRTGVMLTVAGSLSSRRRSFAPGDSGAVRPRAAALPLVRGALRALRGWGRSGGWVVGEGIAS